MANKTSIEWTDYNWNFLRGCSRVSEGCRNCYAEGVAARFSGPGQPYEGLAKFVEHKPRWTGEISFHEDILLLPLRWTKPRKVFVNSMSDLFHEKVTDEMLDKAFAVMALTPQHTYQILTKRPERMKRYFLSSQVRDVFVHEAMQKLCSTLNDGSVPGHLDPLNGRKFVVPKELWANAPAFPTGLSWPLSNVWLGVSVEDQKTADERIPLLLQTSAAVRWISAEPLLGSIGLFNWSTPDCDCLGGHDHDCSAQTSLDWVVVGGESGPNARACDIQNIRSIVEQCKAADVPVFVKQLGADPVTTLECVHCHGVDSPSCPASCESGIQTLYLHDLLSDRKGGKPEEWPTDLQVREFPEMPTAA